MGKASDLFRSLNVSPDSKIKSFLPVQEDIIDRFFDLPNDQKFIAIELPTGSGKSIIGLALLKYWQEGKKVAILTSSNALSEQLKLQADMLNVKSVIIAGRSTVPSVEATRISAIKAYNRGLAIGIINYWAYLRGSEIVPADALVIDDADSFETVASDEYSVTIARNDSGGLWDSVMYELSRNEIYKGKIEAMAFKDNNEESLLVHFQDSVEIADFVRKQLLPKLADAPDELKFSFIRNKDLLHMLLLFVSRDQITFAPMISPIASHQRLAGASKIILMSATLGSEEMIQRILGTQDRITILTDSKGLVPYGTMGIRLTFPMRGLSLSKELMSPALSQITDICNRYKKCLILCTSYPEAHRIKNHLELKGHQVSFYKSELDVLEFSKNKTGVLISAGRMTGLDLPDEACRIAIIPRLPYYASIRDSVFDLIIGDEPYVRHKKANRLAQALGRCNRTPSDYASYFILDGRLASDIMGQTLFFRFLPKGMQAEMDYGQEVVDKPQGVDEALALTDSLLKGDTKQIKNAIESRLTIAYDAKTEETYRNYKSEIKAWTWLISAGDYLNSAKSFEECITKSDDPLRQRTCAWYHYLAASEYFLCYKRYDESKYKEECISHLEKAIDLGKTPWFSALRLTLAKLQNKEEDKKLISNVQSNDYKQSVLLAWSEFFDHVSERKHNYDKTWEEIRGRLTKGTHPQVSETLKEVFKLMGLDSRRLDKKKGEPDVIVIGSIGKRFLALIEIKTLEERTNGGEGGAMVDAPDVAEAISYVPMYQKMFPDQTIIPVIFTNKGSFSETALKKAEGAVKLVRAKEFDVFMTRIFEVMKEARNLSGDIFAKAVLMPKIPTPSELYNMFDPTETELKIESLDKIVSS